jgi:hypothetical protein
MAIQHGVSVPAEGMTDAPRRILLVLPSPMMARNWLSTDVGRLLGGNPALQVTVVTPDAKDRATAEAAGLCWQPLLRPGDISAIDRFRFVAGYLLHMSLVYRFNAISGFRGARERLKQSWPLRRIAIREGLPASRWFGFPLSRSRALYRWLTSLYRSGWQRQREVESLFDRLRPDIVVLGHIQTHFTMCYALAAAARKIATIGMVGSWDQPTTKGPIHPGIGRYLVQGQGVAEELSRYHGIPPDTLEAVGWVQMDPYRQPEIMTSRDAVLSDLGLPSGTHYILFGAYPERLGRHEPALCAEIAARLAASNCSLVVRCHPIDQNWRERFGGLHRSPKVVVLAPELGDLKRLTAQVRHAEVVLSSAGTILLDAVALDTPAIAVAFEDETEPYFDRVARRYDMEHWASLQKTGGLPLARNIEELMTVIGETLENRSRDAPGRARLVMDHLAPLDGAAGRRIAAAISLAARATSPRRAAAE